MLLATGSPTTQLPHVHYLLVQLRNPSMEPLIIDSPDFALDDVSLRRADCLNGELTLPSHPI
jgi:hypothetical protein